MEEKRWRNGARVNKVSSQLFWKQSKVMERTQEFKEKENLHNWQTTLNIGLSTCWWWDTALGSSLGWTKPGSTCPKTLIGYHWIQGCLLLPAPTCRLVEASCLVVWMQRTDLHSPVRKYICDPCRGSLMRRPLWKELKPSW